MFSKENEKKDIFNERRFFLEQKNVRFKQKKTSIKFSNLEFTEVF